MKVGGTLRSDTSGRSAGAGDHVNPGLPVGVLIADGNQAAIGRNTMVTIDLSFRGGRNKRGGGGAWNRAINGMNAIVEYQVLQGPFLIEDQPLTVRRPVGIFKMDGGGVTDATVG